MRVDYIADENAPLVWTPMPVDRIDPSADRGFLDDTPRAACRVRFESGLTLPNWEWLREHGAADSDLADSDAYGELASLLTKEPRNYLLGHPHPQQGPMERECQLVSNGLYCGDGSAHDDPRRAELEAGVHDWRLLLQVDTDEDGPGWMWGDMGTLYYWIPEASLRRADFSKAWLILQCG